MQGTPSAALLLGHSGQGLHQQDNDKPSRPFSLCLRVKLTMHFVGVEGEWREREREKQELSS